jgi:hypothetical protein
MYSGKIAVPPGGGGIRKIIRKGFNVSNSEKNNIYTTVEKTILSLPSLFLGLKKCLLYLGVFTIFHY